MNPIPPADCDRYVHQLLDLYRHTPGTTGHVRPADRELAASLWTRGMALELVETALLLATARRANRSESAPPLPPIRSLHYFEPIIDELVAEPPPKGYREYLLRRIRTDGLIPDDDAADGPE